MGVLEAAVERGRDPGHDRAAKAGNRKPVSSDLVTVMLLWE